VKFEGDSTVHNFCLKAFLQKDIAQRAGITAVREAMFYQRIAPNISMRVPRAIAHIDQEENRAILFMEDLVNSGAHFCSALEPFTPELVAQSLDQIARLHAATYLLRDNAWIPSRLSWLAQNPHFTASQLQEILNGQRSAMLSRRTADASLLLEGMKQLARRFEGNSATLLHGDCHAGNLYLTSEGPGLTDWQLIQHGNWAQDVAYHICSVLPEQVAEREERALLQHYLDCVHQHGGSAPQLDQAWEDYRAAQIYGFYHWAITTRVDPEIVNVAVQRLGSGIERHDTYALLGL
jgi:aminoglycoside phosphotransferase (APT) family kinase protein